MRLETDLTELQKSRVVAAGELQEARIKRRLGSDVPQSKIDALSMQQSEIDEEIGAINAALESLKTAQMPTAAALEVETRLAAIRSESATELDARNKSFEKLAGLMFETCLTLKDLGIEVDPASGSAHLALGDEFKKADWGNLGDGFKLIQEALKTKSSGIPRPWRAQSYHNRLNARVTRMEQLRTNGIATVINEALVSARASKT